MIKTANNLCIHFVLQHQMNPSSNFGSYRASLRAALWRAQGAVDDREKVSNLLYYHSFINISMCIFVSN